MLAFLFSSLLLVSVSLHGGNRITGSGVEDVEDTLAVVKSATVTVAGDFGRYESSRDTHSDAKENDYFPQIPPPTQPTPSPIIASGGDVPEISESGPLSSQDTSSDPELADDNAHTQSATPPPSPSLSLASLSIPSDPSSAQISLSSHPTSPSNSVSSSLSTFESDFTPPPAMPHSIATEEHHCSPHQSVQGKCSGQVSSIATHLEAQRPPFVAAGMLPSESSSAPLITNSLALVVDVPSAAVEAPSETDLPVVSDVTGTDSAGEGVDESTSVSAEESEPLSNVTQEEELLANASSVAPTPTPEPEDVLLSFEEWKKKKEEDAKNEHDDIVQHPTESTTEKQKNGNGKSAKLVSAQQNFANVDCGAKVVSANPEAQNWKAILEANRDVYLLNPCSAKIWFVVELCDEVLLQTVEMANFEMFSSSFKNFNISTSDRFPSREWTTHGVFQANDTHDIQVFALPKPVYVKYVKIEVLSHYGTEHYCPISFLRVKATSMVQEYELVEEIDTDPNGGSVDDVSADGATYPEVELDIVNRAKDVVMNLLSRLLTDDANETDKADDTQPENAGDIVPTPAPQNVSSPADVTEEEAEEKSNTSTPLADTSTEVNTTEAVADDNGANADDPLDAPAKDSGLGGGGGSGANDQAAVSVDVSESPSDAVPHVEQVAVADSTGVSVEPEQTTQTQPDSEPVVPGEPLDVRPETEPIQASPGLASDTASSDMEPVTTEIVSHAIAESTSADLTTSELPIQQNSISTASESELPSEASSSPASAVPTEVEAVAEEHPPTVVDVPPSPSIGVEPLAANTSDTTVVADGETFPSSNASSNSSIAGNEAEVHVADDGAQTTQAPQKESVFIRLNNRIKALDNRLDANVSLIQHYLGDLSASFNRFKKNMSEVQRSNEARFQRLNDSLLTLEEMLAKAVRSNRNVEEHISMLTKATVVLAEELLNTNGKVFSYLATFVLASVGIMVVFMMAFLMMVSWRMTSVSQKQQEALSILLSLVQREADGNQAKPPGKTVRQSSLPLNGIRSGGSADSSKAHLIRAASAGNLYENDGVLNSDSDEWIPVSSRASSIRPTGPSYARGQSSNHPATCPPRQARSGKKAKL